MRLTYFTQPGAPGELVRLVLTLGGDVWEDERIKAEVWKKLKPSAKYGSVPILTTTDGRELAQSKAIARYLAKTTQFEGCTLYPEDPWLAFQVDELMDTVDEVRSKHLVPTFAIQEPSAKRAARRALFATDGTGAIFEGLKRVEAQLDSLGEYMIGGKLSLADLTANVVVNQFRAGWLEGIPTEGWLHLLPKLEAVVEKVSALPAIMAYYQKQAKHSTMYARHARL